MLTVSLRPPYVTQNFSIYGLSARLFERGVKCRFYFARDPGTRDLGRWSFMLRSGSGEKGDANCDQRADSYCAGKRKCYQCSWVLRVSWGEEKGRFDGHGCVNLFSVVFGSYCLVPVVVKIPFRKCSTPRRYIIKPGFLIYAKRQVF